MITITLILFLIIVSCTSSQKDKEEIIEQKNVVKAKDFTLTNLEGEKVTLSDYEGRVVLLDFWATWCRSCVVSFTDMQEIVNQFENENVVFFFINSWEDQEPEEVREKVEELMNNKGNNFHVLFDFNDEVITQYKVEVIPSTFLIDRNGYIKPIDMYNEDLAAMINASL